MKRDFLGILKGETVKELTKKSDDVVMKKESKNARVDRVRSHIDRYRSDT